MGLSADHLDHDNPGAGLDKILPANLTQPPKITKLVSPVSAMSIIQSMEAVGSSITEVEIPIYPAGREGAPRSLDNKECIAGYPQLYHDMPHFRSMYFKIQSLIREMISHYEPLMDTNLIARGEMEDLPKITQQRWRSPGWFVAPMYHLDLKLANWPPDFLEALDAVLDRYVKVLGADLRTHPSRLRMMDNDPLDTSAGMPTMAAGAASQVARLATLRAAPPLNGSPESWLANYTALGDKIGLPYGYIYASALFTRHGPTRKPTNLFVLGGAGYEAAWESESVYDRTRMVYPIPHIMNYLVSPLYVLMSTARSRIMGTWHDPTSQENYIRHFKSVSGSPVSADFSGMDQSMSDTLIELIAMKMKSKGFPSWECDLLARTVRSLTILSPSFMGQPGSVTAMSGVTSWASGWKLTSEMDSAFGLATMLATLKKWDPNIIKKWASNNFVIANLGDDVFFKTMNLKIDFDEFAARAKEIAGADLKISEDLMFLKKMLPVVPGLGKICRPFARVIQQTFFNEDRYDGNGPPKPNALMRVALFARLEGLQNHPDFAKWWPSVWALLSDLKYVDESSPAYKNSMKSGRFCIEPNDPVEVQNYAMSVPSYLSQLTSRAGYEPSAAAFLRTLTALGITNTQVDTQAIRKMFDVALQHDPSEDDVKALIDACEWMR